MAELVGVIREVPGHQFEIRSFGLACQGFCFFHFLACGGGIGFQQLVEEAVDVPAVLRHAFAQYVVGKVGVTQELGDLHAHVHQLLHDAEVVLPVLVRTLGFVGKVKFFP